MTVLATDITIAHRFRGPPESGNGGYVAGLVAQYLDGVAEVTLRMPPPLERALTVVQPAAGEVELRDGDTLVAEGRPGAVDLDIPAPPSYAEAEAARERYRGFITHGLPGCFVCGPERQSPDGLCIFAGPVAGRDLVAAPWTPDDSLSDGNGTVAPEFVWSALDCPGAFAVWDTGKTGQMLLGRLTARVVGAVAVDERCVVTGWALGGEGRKRYSGTALFNSRGDLCGVAHATWIIVPPSP